MSAQWFVFILIAGTALSLLLGAIRFLDPVQRFSWFAVPWPFFVAVTVVSFRFLYGSIWFLTLEQ